MLGKILKIILAISKKMRLNKKNLPMLNKYIMLVQSEGVLTIQKRFIFLLVVLSCVTLNNKVYADPKAETAEHYRSLGYAEQQKGNLQEALSDYTKAIALGMNDAVVYNDIAVLYEQGNYPKRAELYYLKSIELDKNYLPPYLNLGYFYLGQGKKQKAFEYFKVRFEMAESGDPWAQKAKEELIRIYPEYRELVKNIEAKRFNMEVQRKVEQDFIDNVNKSQEHFNLGQKLAKMQKYTEALAEYNQALKLTPNNMKIIEARKKVAVELTKINIKERSDLAIQMLNSGDTISAKREVQKLLTEIPSESN